VADPARQGVAAGDTIHLRSERFGDYEVPADRVIHFPDGLVGLPHARRFALVDSPRPDSPFRCLLCLDAPELGFVVCDPTLLWPDYAADLPALGPATAVLGLVTVPERAVEMTVNLMAPLVIDSESRTGRQLVLDTGRWTTRQPLLG
jgi:flagellar assembly factor FliW